MTLRAFHRKIAVGFSPFLILTSITGILLLFRKDEFYSNDTKRLLLGFHNWEIAAKYVGATLGIALIIICVTGLMIYFKSKKA